MTLQKRKTASGEWRYRAVVKVTGTQVLGDNGWTDKRSAEIDERKLQNRHAQDQLRPLKHAPTLRVYMDTWVVSIARVAKNGEPLAPVTVQNYRDQIRRICAHPIGNKTITSIRDNDIERLRDQLLDSGLATSTVTRDLTLVSRVLQHAAIRGTISKNWADKGLVYRPNPKAKPRPHIDAALGRHILELAERDDRLTVAAYLALGAGMRREEVLGLAWGAIDLDAATIRVLPGRVLTVAKGELHWGSAKTDAGERIIQAPPFVIGALRRHRTSQKVRLAQMSPPRISDLVVDHHGEVWRPDSFSAEWRRFAKRNDLRATVTIKGVSKEVPITYHDLRHGAAQAFVDQGVPVEIAMRMLGWSKQAMLTYYAPDASEDALKLAAVALQRQFRPDNATNGPLGS